MTAKGYKHSCVGTGFIVLDVIRNSVGSSVSEKRFAGGSCGNVLSILAYFGWATNAVGRIGDDQAGRELLADIRKWGVKTDLLRIEAGRGTPIIVQDNYLDNRGRPRHRFSRVCPECGASLPAYRPVLASEADVIATKLPPHSVFYFDRVAPGTLELARMSRATGSLVVFEPSGIKDERLFGDCLKTAHIVKYADDRIQGIHDLVGSAKVPIEIETQGVKGLRLSVRMNGRRGAWKNFPSFSAATLSDAAGSGDWLTAGMIRSLMASGGSVAKKVNDGRAIGLAIQQGQVLAALNCGFEGARGLMYAVDAKRVLDLVEAVVKGKKKLADLQVGPVRHPNGRRNRNTCSICSGTHSLHS